jgi:autotransporter family porin
MRSTWAIPAARGFTQRIHLTHRAQKRWNLRRRPLKVATLSSVMLAVLGLCGQNAALAADVNCTTTLYYCTVNPGDNVTVNTSVAQGTAPLQGYGVYLGGGASYLLNNVDITTSGAGADAIRTNDVATYFYANDLKIRASGSSADGINVASNTKNPYDAVVHIAGSADIESVSGVGARANNLRSTNNSVILLPSHSTVRVTGSGDASNLTEAAGYAVYAGNRSADPNDLMGTATVGNSYVFVGADSVLSSNMDAGHVVYANKGGLVQLGDGVSATANGTGGYALYAATEKQGLSGASRPGSIFLEGGATLRAKDASASSIVMQANGADSIIASKAMAVPSIPDNAAFLADRDKTSNAFRQQLDKSATTETRGVFDVMGVMDARAGGRIDLNMADGSHFVGSTAMTGTDSAIQLDIAGTASQWQIAANSTLSTLRLSDGATLKPYRIADETTAFQLTGDFTNAGGVIDLRNGVAGESLTIHGNYAASGNAWLRLDTVLGDSSSQSDKLIINNGTVSGSTQVAVSNAGGLGAQTTGDGIPIVETHNATIDQGAGFWAPANSIQAGLYAYNVVRGTSAPENWYLSSAYTPPVDPPAPPGPIDPPGPTEPPEPPAPPPTVPPEPVEPPAPTEPQEPKDPSESKEPPAPPSTVTPSVPNIRNAVPVYTAAPALAGKLGLAMLGTYHDRVGEDHSDAPSNAQEPKDKAGWGRVFGETGSVGDRGKGSLQNRLDSFYQHGPSYDYDLSGFQVGLDLHRTAREDGIRDIAGLYVGHGSVDADVQAVYGGKAGTLSMDGSSLGGYWTRKGPSNWYVDGVAQYTVYGNVKGATVDGYRMKTDGRALTASLEGGYPFALGNDWTVEPQAQLIWQRLSLDDSSDQAGRVLYGDTDTYLARIGARLSKEWTQGDGRKTTTWARANLWHAFGDDAKTSFPTLAGGPGTVATPLGGTWAQVGVGVTGQVSPKLQLFASGDYSRTLDAGRGHSLAARAGLRYAW